VLTRPIRKRNIGAISTAQVLSILVPGKEECAMARELSCGQTELVTKANGSSTKLAVKASSTIQTETSTTECGATIRPTVMGSISTPREPITTASGRTTNSMVRESRLGLKVLDTKESMT